MNNTAAEVVRKMLVDLAVAVEPTFAAGVYTGQPWPAFDSAEPDGIAGLDNCVTVYDTDGGPGTRIMVGLAVQRDLGVQVRVRAQTHAVGWVKAEAIRAALETAYHRQVNVSGNRYLVWALSRVGQVLPIGAEVPGSKRRVFTINAVVTIKTLA